MKVIEIDLSEHLGRRNYLDDLDLLTANGIENFLFFDIFDPITLKDVWIDTFGWRINSVMCHFYGHNPNNIERISRREWICNSCRRLLPRRIIKAKIKEAESNGR